METEQLSNPTSRWRRSNVMDELGHQREGQPSVVWPDSLQWVVRLSPIWICALQVSTLSNGLPIGKILGSIGLLAVIAVCWFLLVRLDMHPALHQLAMILSIGAGCGLDVFNGGGEVYVVGYASLYVSLFFFEFSYARWTWAAATIAVGATTGLVGKPDAIGGLGNGIGAFFFGLAALSYGRVQRESHKNAELVEELRQSRESERIGAVVAERARLARELHDVLAHTLSSLALHLESTRVLARSRDVDDEVTERIARGVSLARTGLEEARNAVGTLRDDELPGPERLPKLVDDFSRSTGVVADFEQSGDPVNLAPEARIALFRSAQEALTNIGKHANARHVEVRLAWFADAVRLDITDDGDGTGSPRVELAGGGNGLRGMRERAELAGGHLHAGPTGRGFKVELRLPA